MKTQNYITIALLSLNLTLAAQIKVQNTGQVCIGTTSSSYNYRLTVDGGQGYSINSITNHSSDYSWNIQAEVNRDKTKAYVVKNGTNQTFYVYGNGYAVSREVYLTSDKRYKQNIKPFTDYSKLWYLNAVSFEYKESNSVKNDSTETIMKDNETDSTQTNIHYGFLAQEVKEIFPDLVIEDEVGYMSVNYIAFIPMLIEAYKNLEQNNSDLQKQLKNQIQEIDSIKSTLYLAKDDNIQSKRKSMAVPGEITEDGDSENVGQSILYQNTPNPFLNETEINYFINSSIRTAKLLILNMQGTLIKQVDINNKGMGNITIKASELNAGMYLYTLICDGQEVDTKRMILTE
jgi:hypothetical protein